MFSEKRAITPVIATLLMIAITVAAVAGFYIFYNSFIKQSKVSGDNPSVSLLGPTTGDQGDAVVLSLKNSGNVDLSSWKLTGIISSKSATTKGTLTVGSQVSFTTVLPILPTSKMWTIKAQAWTKGGSTAVDILSVEPS